MVQMDRFDNHSMARKILRTWTFFANGVSYVKIILEGACGNICKEQKTVRTWSLGVLSGSAIFEGRPLVERTALVVIFQK